MKLLKLSLVVCFVACVLGMLIFYSPGVFLKFSPSLTLGKICRGRSCRNIDVHISPAWFIATIVTMTIALVLSVGAGLSRMYAPFSAGLEIAAGILTLTAAGVLGLELYRGGDMLNLSWALGISFVAGIIFLVNGTMVAVVYASTSATNREERSAGTQDTPTREGQETTDE